MFYYLSQLPEWLMANGHAQWGDWLSPLRVFQYITFRGAGAAVTALVLCWLLGPMVIRWLKRIGVRQEYQDRARKDGKMTDGVSKRGVPTMGGLLIVGVIDLSALLWAQWNPLVTLTLLSMLVLCLLGFYDDYSKITRQNSDGLTEKVKLVVQFVLSATIAVYLWRLEETRQLITDVMVPFLKDPILSGPSATMVISWAAVMGVVITVCAIMGSSNAVNFTDGLDGLAVGSVLIVSMVFYVFTYIAGNAELARELYVPAVSGAGELSVVCAAMMGACLGFLWFNCFPARVFMGDTGSLALGGSLGIVAVLVHQPWVLVIAGGIFVLEAASVILQRSWFKWTRIRTGEGRRIFLMAPLHHHFEKKGWHENQVVVRFYIIGILFAVLALATLKLR
ncbi:MAG: phospho-N-acetylmuramoyl-pentapeptide-transferase [Verrucomicrobiota bacterium]|jgi:phospho-N-acetylmuramoyl-pentapeptide-transferase|nr:phospho-N-acetylmuramoyl-pentapeptide-transferase [Verrucomicrobiota bacterium]MDG1831623.1 phospho-N-acetylmuramoyl-pentapeptide-transferase [Verrucomicrobiota bacterium]